MKLFTILLILLFSTSCLMKKEDTEIKLDAALSGVSKGFFIVNKQIYYSDGVDMYCGFKDWDHLESLSGGLTNKEKKAIEMAQEPEMMKFILHCTKDILDGKHTSKKALLRE